MKTNEYPTPWTISYSKIIASNGLVVCSLPSRKSNDSENLIAAAPDLLSALRECVNVLSEHSLYDDDGDSAEGFARLLAMSAIAKAEGK